MNAQIEHASLPVGGPRRSAAGMRIGVDATCWLNNRGYGRHLRSLLKALAGVDAGHRYTLVMDSRPDLADVPSNCELRIVEAETPAAVAASASGRRSISDMWRMGRAMSNPSFDLALFPTIYSYVPTFGRATRIVMIHDVIAETFPHLTLPSRAARLAWQAKVALGRWQAHAIVTVSEYSRRCIADRFKLDPARIFVVGEASDGPFRVLSHPEFTSALTNRGLHKGERYVVYVGGFSPHKNLDTLIEAFGTVAARDDMSDVKLVLVGDYRKEVFLSHYEKLRALIEKRAMAPKVIFTGYLPDEDLAVLLNLSAVLALPSLMEGFGLPAVEAAACGCPVIASKASPLPELLGAGGIFIDPTRADLESALVTVLESPDRRREMREAGTAAAAALTWEKAAYQMLDVFDEVSRWRRAR